MLLLQKLIEAAGQAKVKNRKNKIDHRNYILIFQAKTLKLVVLRATLLNYRYKTRFLLL